MVRSSCALQATVCGVAMAFVQVKRASRVWAVAAATALAGATALVSVPATATAADPVVAPTEGMVVAPSSTVRLTGGVGLTDDAVYGETATGIVTIPRDGSATDWSPVTVDGAPLTGHLLAAEGDALLVDAADGTADTLAWHADGTWSSRSVPNGTTLGHGGIYALLPPTPAPDDMSDWTLVDARSGAVAMRYTNWDTVVVAIDGSVLWNTRSYGASLASVDIPTGAVRPPSQGTGYGSTDLQVAGSWALDRDWDGAATVMDVRANHVYVNWRLPEEEQELIDPTLARDAVVGLRTAPSGTVLVARELAGDRREQPVGSVIAPGASTAGALDVDESGSSVVYRDPAGLAHLADLDWVAPAATVVVDTAAPSTPDMYLDQPPLTGSESLTITTWAADHGSLPFWPSGLASVELRYQQRDLGQSSFGSWTTESAPLSAASAFTRTLTVTRGTTTCAQARARDKAGNTSPWSASMCSTLDGTLPRLTKVSGPASALRAVSGKATAKLTYAAADNLKVASYDVRYKKAPQGSTTYGAWVYPASWQRATATSRSVTATTGQRVCLSVRARDTAGNATAWSSSRCTYVDGTAPRLTRVSTPPRWRGVPSAGSVRQTISFAGKDDRSLRFDVRVRRATGTGAFGSWTTVASGTTKHSYTRTLRPGDEVCYKVRARDGVGHVSAWSSVARCTSVALPASSRLLDADHRTTVGGTTVAALRESNVVAYPGHYMWDASTDQTSGRGIRIQVRACPTCGVLFVDGDTHPKRISLVSSRPAWRYVTVTWKQKPYYEGPIYLRDEVPAHTRTSVKTYIRSWTLIH